MDEKLALEKHHCFAHNGLSLSRSWCLVQFCFFESKENFEGIVKKTIHKKKKYC